MNLRNQTTCLMAWAAISLTSLLTSCHGDYTFDPDVTLEVQQIAYDYNFRERFGDIDPEQNWGFDDMEAITVGDSVPTRAAVTTRAANPNNNEWEKFTTEPEKVTSQEAQDVYDYFRSLSPFAETGITMRWSDFFVQHVWKGKEEYTAGNGDKVNDVSSRMNQLVVGENDHVNNFNGSQGDIMLMQHSSTSTFGYHNSLDSKFHNEYLIVYVPQYDAYYVGFDFYANGQNPNEQVERDGIYTDWIIKVVPANYYGMQRIMCEDLGDTDDFDFNDVVFDVSIQQSWWPVGTFAKIYLQAAGGTLPVELYHNGERICEVHEAFGVPTTTMVNTTPDMVRPFVLYSVKVSDQAWGDVFNPNDIEIRVNNTEKGIIYTLSANLGSAPYKICVPSTVAFTAERENIELKYPKFRDWVNDSSQKFWE